LRSRLPQTNAYNLL